MVVLEWWCWNGGAGMVVLEWGAGIVVLEWDTRKTLTDTCLTATLSVADPTWTDIKSNPGRRRERLVTNSLSHGTGIPLQKECGSLRRVQPKSRIGT
jgi:hypothetical protein